MEAVVATILSSNKCHILGFLFLNNLGFSDKLGRFQHFRIFRVFKFGNFDSLNFSNLTFSF